MNFECETFPMKFYKYILGVHKRATNLAINGDSGRTPYFIDIICSILKYFRRIGMMDDNTLLSQTLETSKKLHESGKQSWYPGIVFILEELDINLDMGIDEVENKLIKRSMENGKNK